jgi:hypothetical protein
MGERVPARGASLGVGGQGVRARARMRTGPCPSLVWCTSPAWRVRLGEPAGEGSGGCTSQNSTHARLTHPPPPLPAHGSSLAGRGCGSGQAQTARGAHRQGGGGREKKAGRSAALGRQRALGRAGRGQRQGGEGLGGQRQGLGRGVVPSSSSSCTSPPFTPSTTRCASTTARSPLASSAQPSVSLPTSALPTRRTSATATREPGISGGLSVSKLRPCAAPSAVACSGRGVGEATRKGPGLRSRSPVRSRKVAPLEPCAGRGDVEGALG